VNAASPAYIELIDFIVARVTPEALLHFRPSAASQQRVAELIAGQHAGTLSTEEVSELDEYCRLSTS
jgi:hypothetical protein